MDKQLSKLKKQISKIEELKGTKNWGPEFQLWKIKTERLVSEIFGKEGLGLFKRQQTMTISYYGNPGFNTRQYQKELGNRKKILEGLLDDFEEESSFDNTESNSVDVLKEVWQKESAIKENLLSTNEVKALHGALMSHLENILNDDSLPSLRFKKMKAGKSITWWSAEGSGYPISNPWERFQPLLDLLEQHEAGKTIKNRLEVEGLFVESRSQGNDQHLLIGKRDGSAEKAHIIIDGKTGEIRVEDNQQEPTELVSRVEAILTLPSGKKIKTTREAIEEISES